jgi:hypothetical protein
VRDVRAHVLTLKGSTFSGPAETVHHLLEQVYMEGGDRVSRWVGLVTLRAACRVGTVGL